MKATSLTLALLTFLCLVLIFSGFSAASAATPSLKVSPTAAVIGSKIIVTGSGYAPNTSFTLQWSSVDVSWLLSGNPTQISDIKSVPTQSQLASVTSDASGAFSVSLTVPVDYGGKHFIQAFDSTGAAVASQAIFTLEPSFTISGTSGPAGTPITVRANGLSYGLYATNYHIMWDNKDFGYMTAVTTKGVANTTFYAVGNLGVHYIDIYQGYPGAAYLNPQENPSAGNWFPPYLPYHASFTITSDVYSQGIGGSGALALLSLGLVLTAFVSTPILAIKSGGRRGFPTGPNYGTRARVGMTRTVGVVAVIMALVFGGGAIVLAQNTQQTQVDGNAPKVTATTTMTVTQPPVTQTVPSGSTTTVNSVSTVISTATTTITATASSSSSKQQASPFAPQVAVVRPTIKIPVNIVTTGPRITVTPNVATVGSTITINGAGFAANTLVPVSWSSRQGNNLNGFKIANLPLKNVTSTADGSFSLTSKVPYDLEGIHFISVGDLTKTSNATFYVERSASISASSGPQGSPIVIKMTGVGWSFLTNIAVLDYDNSYMGYGCGFNSQGNVTFTLYAAGSPGVHSIDIYPSIYLGPQAPATPAVYRYPLMTPYDHPAFSPSFHFSYLITGVGASQGLGGSMVGASPALVAELSMVLACVYLALEFSGRFPITLTRFHQHT